MSKNEDSSVQSSMPVWGKRVLPILLLTIVTTGVVGKVVGIQPFADQAWFPIAAGGGAAVYLAVLTWKSASDVSGRSRWTDHALTSCFVLFLGICAVTAICILLDEPFR